MKGFGLDPPRRVESDDSAREPRAIALPLLVVAVVVAVVVYWVLMGQPRERQCRDAVPDTRGCSHQQHSLIVVDGAPVCLCPAAVEVASE